MKKLTTGAKELIRTNKIVVEDIFRDVFSGADAGDTIERLIRSKLEKIADFDATLAFQAECANALARNFRLLRTQGLASELQVAACIMSAAPPTPQIDKPLSRFQAQLAVM